MGLHNTGPTQLELRRAAMLARGMSTGDIADADVVSAGTVKDTMKRLMHKTRTTNRMSMVIELMRVKILVWDRSRSRVIVSRYYFGGEDEINTD